jgi:hypothetical protein
MKLIFGVGCYGCIFHGTGNSAQLWQNFGISRRRGVKPPQTPFGTPLLVVEMYWDIDYRAEKEIRTFSHLRSIEKPTASNADVLLKDKRVSTPTSAVIFSVFGICRILSQFRSFSSVY